MLKEWKNEAKYEFDIQSASVLQDDGTEVDGYEAYFTTKWGPPADWYDDLVKRGFYFVAHYAERGCDFAGVFTSNDGESEGDYRSAEDWDEDIFGIEEEMLDSDAEEYDDDPTEFVQRFDTLKDAIDRVEVITGGDFDVVRVIQEYEYTGKCGGYGKAEKYYGAAKTLDFINCPDEHYDRLKWTLRKLCEAMGYSNIDTTHLETHRGE